ncbi:hypothetical protein SDC9_20873 [bioreactor metagenome]|uniref:Restriction endonuclease type IV Mrr domain-containing protein n=1 Tax=bioreactor metagenome TaxID=1076179 RepID=A0A644U8C1_9ZZZZ|nr:restriction endonuclease [Negativicutes bacterium]
MKYRRKSSFNKILNHHHFIDSFMGIIALSIAYKVGTFLVTNHPYTLLVMLAIISLSALGYRHLTILKLFSMAEIDRLDGREFELYLGKLFNTIGWHAEVTAASGDQGADLILRRFNKRIAVQAKHYSGPVGNKAIQEVVAAIAYYGCSGAMVVTNSYFTESAKKLATANKVELWDRERLYAEIIKLSEHQDKKIILLRTVGYYTTIILSFLVRIRR